MAKKTTEKEKKDYVMLGEDVATKRKAKDEKNAADVKNELKKIEEEEAKEGKNNQSYDNGKHVILGEEYAAERAAKRRKGEILLTAAALMATPPILMAIDEATDHQIAKGLKHIIEIDNAPGHNEHPEKPIFIDDHDGYLVNEKGEHYATKEGKNVKFNNVTGDFEIEKGGAVEKILEAKDLHKYLEDKDGIDFNILPYELVEAPADGGLGPVVHEYGFEWDIPHSQMSTLVKHMVKDHHNAFAGKENAKGGKIMVKYDPEKKMFHGEIIIDSVAVYEVDVGSDLGIDQAVEALENSVVGDVMDVVEDGGLGHNHDDNSHQIYVEEFAHKATIDQMSHKLNAANDKITTYEGILAKADEEADKFKQGEWSDIPARILEMNNYITELKGYLDDADKVADQYKDGNWQDLDDRIHDMLDELNGMKDHINDIDGKYTQHWGASHDLFGTAYSHLSVSEQNELQNAGFDTDLLDDIDSNREVEKSTVEIIPSKDYSLIKVHLKDGSDIELNVSRALGEHLAALQYEYKGLPLTHGEGFTPEYFENEPDHETFVKDWAVAKINHKDNYYRLNRMDDNGQPDEIGSQQFRDLYRKIGVKGLETFYEAWENGDIKYIEGLDLADDKENGMYFVAYDKNGKEWGQTALTIPDSEKFVGYYHPE